MPISERITVTWSSEEKPACPPDLQRYKRQLMLRGFTPAHQQKLCNSTALVAGVGGLGGTAAVYLAVAGIGKLVIFHSGNLTLSNMNRQILMKNDRIGQPRAPQAKETINAINPDVIVETHDARINKENLAPALASSDIALSARPNFSERKILNEGCVRLGKPMVEAAMDGMQGYLFNYIPGKKTPCLECVFPETDPQWEELGFPVMGPVPGVLGAMMAMEAIKIISGFGRPLESQMLMYDALNTETKKFHIRRNGKCPVCGRS